MASTPVHNDAELDRLAGEGALWPLVAACERLLENDPLSIAGRTYRGAALVGLGIRELAAESVEGIESEDADAIRAACASVAPSRLGAREVERSCERNLAAMGQHARDLNAAFGSWREDVRQGGVRFFRAGDGNVLCERDGSLLSTVDEQAGAAACDLGFTPPASDPTASDLPGVLVVEGFTAPWLLQRVLTSLRGGAQGYTPRVYVVERRGAARALDALAMCDFSAILEQASVRWCLGDDAVECLRTELHALWEWKLPQRVIAPNESAPLRDAVLSAIEAQHEKHAALSAATSRPDRSRSPREWGDRFREACDNDGPPLRVLLPSTRYTSYVRHAMQGLAGAIRRSGHHAVMLEEPSSDLRPAATFELAAHDRERPDLTLSSNWPRALRANAWPQGAPAICWVQDMLGPLLDPALGKAQGELDFLCGLINAEIVNEFAYPRERAVFLTTPACPERFHDGPPAKSIDAVDVAYMSHQSEAPGLFLERLCRSASNQSERQLVEKIGRAVQGELGDRDGADATHAHLRALTQSCLEDAGHTPDAASLSRLTQMVTVPLAERWRRHTMIAWAVAICEDHDLRLGLFGDGWERTAHAAHARGRLPHDEALRACYQSAACHLHASLSSNAHQRVFECALSGGLMLRHGPSPDAWAIQMVQHYLLSQCEPDFEKDGCQGYLVSTSDEPAPPACAEYDPIRLASVLGCEARPAYDYYGTIIRPAWINRADAREWGARTPRLPLEQFPDWSFDNARETLFASSDELEAMILRAVRDDDWRRETVAHHRERALAYNTTDVFWSRLLAAIRDALENSD